MSKKKIKKPLSASSKSHKNQLLKYYCIVLGLAITYHLLSSQDWFLKILEPVFFGYAAISSDVLNVFGQETVALGREIKSAAFSLMIKVGCDGITPMILYTMSILAFPIHFKFKWKGILLGIIALFVLNLFRIISLFLIGKNMSYDFFDFMHIDVWSVFFMVFTVFIWLMWMKSVFDAKFLHAQNVPS